MKHTPGPWNIHPHAQSPEPLRITPPEPDRSAWNWLAVPIAKGEMIIGHAEFSDCTDCGWPRVVDLEEARANARLMVAAPRLLEALEYAVKQVPALLGVPGVASALTAAKGDA
jgi:hypothetical protein